MHSRGDIPENNAEAHISTRCSAILEFDDDAAPKGEPPMGFRNPSVDIYFYPMTTKWNNQTSGPIVESMPNAFAHTVSHDTPQAAQCSLHNICWKESNFLVTQLTLCKSDSAR
jgi:hypothetical protein